MISTSLVEPRETDKEHVAGGNCGTAPLGVRVSQRAVSHVPVAASFPACRVSCPRGGKFFNLSVSRGCPSFVPDCPAPLGRPSFRRSEIPTCHPKRHGTHNKSDILLVSSSFADPSSSCPRGGKFPKRVRESRLPLVRARLSRTAPCCKLAKAPFRLKSRRSVHSPVL
jgi:hypothetical protein